jgi:hypothetical protein
MSGDHGEIRLKGFPLAISQAAWIVHVHAIQCSSRVRSLMRCAMSITCAT